MYNIKYIIVCLLALLPFAQKESFAETGTLRIFNHCAKSTTMLVVRDAKLRQGCTTRIEIPTANRNENEPIVVTVEKIGESNRPCMYIIDTGTGLDINQFPANSGITCAPSGGLYCVCMDNRGAESGSQGKPG